MKKNLLLIQTNSKKTQKTFTINVLLKCNTFPENIVNATMFKQKNIFFVTQI